MDKTNLKPNEITEEHLEQAANIASYWAKKRMLKKIDKVIYRPKAWVGVFKEVDSPLTGQKIKVLDEAKFHGVVCLKPRSPKDLESYTTNFVNHQLAKVTNG